MPLLLKYVKNGEAFRDVPALLDQLKRRPGGGSEYPDYQNYDHGDYSQLNAADVDKLIEVSNALGIVASDIDWPTSIGFGRVQQR